MNISYGNWEPIEDLPATWPDFHRAELDLVREQWLQERAILAEPGKLQRLHEQLAMRWAIETGVIERLYTIERGVTETLIELGIESLAKGHAEVTLTRNARRLILDQLSSLEFVFDFINQNRKLSLSYIKELHQSLTRNQDYTEAIDQFGNHIQVSLIKGAWKKMPNNPTRPDGGIHYYCPPEFVQDEMERLEHLHLEHVEQGVPVDVEAAWLHHRFTQIHPFQDGNGRVARALATLVFLRGEYLPLVVRDTEHRESYIYALELADKGDLRSLVNLFARIQQDDLADAINFLRDLRGAGIVQLAKSAAERAHLRQQQDEAEIRALTEQLIGITITRFEEIRRELDREFAQSGVTIAIQIDRSTEASEAWWNNQIVAIANAHHYWADLRGYRQWVRLRLRLPDLDVTQTNIVVSFHKRERIPRLMLGNAFMSSSGITGNSAARHEDNLEDWEVLPVAREPFNYSKSHSNPEAPYREWLDSTVETALEKWQSRL